MNSDKKTSFKALRFRRGIGGIALTAVVIAAVVIVNYLVSRLPSDMVRIDTSEEDYYTLDQVTVDMAESLDVDVTIYHVAARGNEDGRIAELLRRYEDLSPRITVKNIDSGEDPSFVSKYTDEDLADNSVIVESELRSYVISRDKIIYKTFSSYEDYYYYMMGYNAGEDYFAGELMFTSALDYVSRHDLPVLYTLGGHGESVLDENYSDSIKNENVPVTPLELLTVDSVPDDCGAVLINNPRTDITDDELDKLTRYTSEGGNILLITSYGAYSESAMPNLSSLCKAAGMYAADGLVNDENRCYGYSYMLLPELMSASGGPVDLLENTNIYVLTSSAQGIGTVEDSTSTFLGILRTTDGAYLMDADESGYLEEVDGDTTGTYYVGAMTESAADGTRGETSRFIWYSSPSVTDSTMNYYTGGGNMNLFTASVGYLCEKETSVSVLAKPLTDEVMVIDERTGNYWWVTMTIIVPVVILGAGFTVWLRRRRK